MVLKKSSRRTEAAKNDLVQVGGALVCPSSTLLVNGELMSAWRDDYLPGRGHTLWCARTAWPPRRTLVPFARWVVLAENVLLRVEDVIRANS